MDGEVIDSDARQSDKDPLVFAKREHRILDYIVANKVRYECSCTM